MDKGVEAARSPLDRLFDPASVAIVGATESFDKVGGRVLTSLIFNAFKGAIFPVNPGRQTVQGLTAYPSVESLPQAPDLVILAVPAKDILDQAERACLAGAGSIVVFASGFAELGAEGAEAQKRLTELVRGHGVRLVGPNCLGFMNGVTGVMASSTVTMKDRRLRGGRLAFVSQSGAIATFWINSVLDRDLGVSKWVSTGNEADVGLSDVLGYLVEDPDTDVIALYVEGFREGRRLRAAFARAAQLRKPIIVLKSGRSAAGAEATASHTGALAGEDEVYTALFDQYGVAQVDSLQEMIDLSRVLLTQAPVTGRRACVISLSGGAGALMTDAASKYGFDLPPISPEATAKLQPHFPAYIQVRNPIDLSDKIIVEPEMFRHSLEITMASGEFDAILTFMAGRSPRLVEEAERASLEIFPRWKGAYANVWQATTPELPRRLEAGGVLVFDEIPQAVQALARTRRMAEVWADPPPAAIPQVWSGGGDRLMSEQASKAYLVERAALETPAGVLLAVGEAAAARLAAAGPFAVKLQSAALPHKSGHGAIEIGVKTPADVDLAAERMLAMARGKALPVEGVLVEAMEDIEIEFLVGLRHDPVLGPFLVVGRGGVAVEVDPDVARAFLPLSAERIAGLFRSLRCRKLLDGFRGRPPVPVDALAATVARLCELFARSQDLAEIEINPLCVCRGGRIVAIDAAVRLRADA